MSALRYRLLDRALAAQVAPDAVLRAGSRFGAWDRERRESRGGVVAQEARLRALIERMSTGPVAEVPEKANEQHYELPADFFALVLGPRRKYSGGLWEPGTTTLRGLRGGDARALLRARPGSRRDADPRPRLRLGIAVAVAGRAVPARGDHRDLELQRPTGVHRGRGRRARD